MIQTGKPHLPFVPTSQTELPTKVPPPADQSPPQSDHLEMGSVA
jgi:hypothetical protein